jgi:arylsulfatase A-like enzyme
MRVLTRREWLGSMGGGLAAAGGASPERPNVLFLAVDDLRPQLGCYGDRYAKTPHIDGLAAGGVVFQRAYCQQAVCGPSRASLLTGLRPDTIRVYDLETPFRKAVPDAVTLPQCFKQQGYHTESIGKIFHGSEVMLDHGSWSVPEKFPILLKRDQYVLESNKSSDDPWRKTLATERVDVPDNAYRDGQIAEAAVEALDRLKGRPFFLGVGFNKPHLPFAAPSKYWDLYERKTLPLALNPYLAEDASPYALSDYSELRSYGDFPDAGPMPEAKAREAVHGYYAATSYTDAQVGKVLDQLQRLNLGRNTVVVLWGDHGWHLGEQGYWGKTTNFEICVRAPLIVRAPQVKGGAKTRALVEFVDIYPTLATLCGITPPASLEGASAVPVLRRPERPWKECVFSQYPRKGPNERRVMGYSMRTDRFRYTEWRLPGGQVDSAELYDHTADPRETRNVVHLAGYREDVGRLSEAIVRYDATWMAGGAAGVENRRMKPG